MKILNLIKKWLKISNNTIKEKKASDLTNQNTTGENNLIDSHEKIDITKSNAKLESNKNIYPFFLSKINDNKIQFEETVRTDKGLLEDFFFDYLANIKNYKFRNDIRIKTKEGFYTPDFCLPEHEFVIEIDEPYTVDSNGQLKPIHYLGYDDKRNKIFLEGGWQILRFAEEQIAKYPDACCSYIIALLSKQSFEINKIPFWTYEEATSMIINDYRNSYLSIKYKGVNGNSKFSYRSLLVRSMRLNENEKVIFYIENQYSNQNFSIRECWISKDDFVKTFTQTDFFKKTINEDYLLSDMFVNNLPTFVNIIQFGDLDIRLCGYGTQNKYYFNLAQDIDFQIIISENKTLEWINKWNELLLNESKTKKRR